MSGETGAGTGGENVDEPSTSHVRSCTRRRLVRGAAGVGAALAAPGLASAQETTDGPTTGHDPEGVTTPIAISDSAPTFGYPDYLGLFVQITGYDREIDPSGVGSCGFLKADEKVAGFDAHLIDKKNDEHQSAETTVYAADSNSEIEPGKLFVITKQTKCQGGYVTLLLDGIGASSIDASTPSRTGSPIPGFGVGAALIAAGGAALGLARRSED